MQTLDLSVTPNQQITYTADGSKFTIKLRTLLLQTYADISRDGVAIISGMRCPPSRLILPYQYLEGAAGNFAFQTTNDAWPYYADFGVGTNLIYITAAELLAARNG